MLLVSLIITGRLVSHYRDKYQRAEKGRIETEQVANEYRSTLAQMTNRFESNAALDAKYTKELSDAKSQIDALRADIAAGRRRLQLHAQCVPQTGKDATASSLGNAATARLDDAAQRDYFILRERVTQMQKQLEAAQQWIREAQK